MFSYSQYIRNEGREEGLEVGRYEGIREGRKEGWKEGQRKGHKEGRKEGHKVGHKEGRKTGIRESSLKIAKKLLKDQTFTIQKISDITDLTMDELQSLKNEITQC